jgi:putative acetyltransferase
MLTIRQDDLSGAPTRALLALHLAGMHETTPAEFVHALDLSSLQAPEITVWSAWDGEEIAGIAALKSLGDGGGEVKSMRTHPRHLRQGVAAALLETVIEEARRRGYRRLSLETGTEASFLPAVALYRKRGFTDCTPFGDYQASDFNQFLQMDL